MGLRDLIRVLKAGAQQCISKPITCRFPPETPLSKQFRGRHIFYPGKCTHCGSEEMEQLVSTSYSIKKLYLY